MGGIQIEEERLDGPDEWFGVRCGGAVRDETVRSGLVCVWSVQSAVQSAVDKMLPQPRRHVWCLSRDCGYLVEADRGEEETCGGTLLEVLGSEVTSPPLLHTWDDGLLPWRSWTVNGGEPLLGSNSKDVECKKRHVGKMQKWCREDYCTAGF